MKGKVIEQHRASAKDAVLMVEGGVGDTHRRTPCGGCPWRLDQIGEFSAEAFRLAADTSYDASLKLFGCHESGPRSPTTCAGFLLRNSIHNLRARMRGISGGPGCSSPVPLHESYRAMAVANGVAPDDPALERCRADNQGPVVPRRDRR